LSFVDLASVTNIIQRYNDEADFIYSDNIEEQNLIEFLLNLIDSKLKLIKNKPVLFQEVKATWDYDFPNDFGTIFWNPKSYKKSFDLPKKQESHIVCQFDIGHENYCKNLISNKNISYIVKTLGHIYNIGENDIEGTINCTQISLQDKWELLKNAKNFIGTNGGLSHLSLMTNVNTFIVFEKQNNPWFFFPDNANIIEIQNFKKSISFLKFF